MHAEKSTFSEMLQDVSIVEGCSATFWCLVYPYDLPVRWFLDGIELINQGRIKIREEGELRHLEIENCTKMDEGEVSVHAGDEMCTANLLVEGLKIGVLTQKLLTWFGQ